MMFAKFEGTADQSVTELHNWLRAVDDEIHFSSVMTAEDNFVKVYFETARDGKEFLSRILEDYETLGFEIEQQVELDLVTVFVDDPEINSYFLHQRINIQSASCKALSEIIVEVSNDNAELAERLDVIETAGSMNGMYDMRKIINVIVNGLDEKGIFVGEAINKVSMKTIH